MDGSARHILSLKYGIYQSPEGSTDLRGGIDAGGILAVGPSDSSSWICFETSEGYWILLWTVIYI